MLLNASSKEFSNLVGNKTSRKVTGSGNSNSPESSEESSDSGSLSHRHRFSGSEGEGSKSAPVCVLWDDNKVIGCAN